MSVDTQHTTDYRASVEVALDDLSAGEKAWAELSLTERADLLDRVRALTGTHAADWVAAAVAIKGLGPELAAGRRGMDVRPVPVGHRPRRCRDSAGGTSRPAGARSRTLHFGTAPGGRTTVKVLPRTSFDRLLLSGFSAETCGCSRGSTCDGPARRRTRPARPDRGPAGSASCWAPATSPRSRRWTRCTSCSRTTVSSRSSSTRITDRLLPGLRAGSRAADHARRGPHPDRRRGRRRRTSYTTTLVDHVHMTGSAAPTTPSSWAPAKTPRGARQRANPRLDQGRSPANSAACPPPSWCRASGAAPTSGSRPSTSRRNVCTTAATTASRRRSSSSRPSGSSATSSSPRCARPSTAHRRAPTTTRAATPGLRPRTAAYPNAGAAAVPHGGRVLVTGLSPTPSTASQTEYFAPVLGRDRTARHGAPSSCTRRRPMP